MRARAAPARFSSAAWLWPGRFCGRSRTTVLGPFGGPTASCGRKYSSGLEKLFSRTPHSVDNDKCAIACMMGTRYLRNHGRLRVVRYMARIALIGTVLPGANQHQNDDCPASERWLHGCRARAIGRGDGRGV